MAYVDCNIYDDDVAEITRACTWVTQRVVYMCGTWQTILVAVLLIIGSKMTEVTVVQVVESNSHSLNDVIIVATVASSSVPG